MAMRQNVCRVQLFVITDKLVKTQQEIKFLPASFSIANFFSIFQNAVLKQLSFFSPNIISRLCFVWDCRNCLSQTISLSKMFLYDEHYHLNNFVLSKKLSSKIFCCESYLYKKYLQVDKFWLQQLLRHFFYCLILFSQTIIS